MRRISKISLFAIVLSLASCQDPIDIEVPNAEPQLVINGQISDKDSAFVEISATANYFATGDNNRISGARVSIWEGSSELALLSEKPDRAGYYTGAFQGTVGGIYHLEVRVDGDYPTNFLGDWVSAPDTLRACPEVDSLNQASLNRTTNPRAFREGDYALMYFGDIPNVKNYFRFKRTLNDSSFAREIIVFDDLGVDGQYFGSSLFPPIAIYGPFEEPTSGEDPDTLTVRIESISPNFQEFLALVNSQQQVGSPFDAPPALVIGNIHRKNNTDDYAFGYFSVIGTNSNGLRYQP